MLVVKRRNRIKEVDKVGMVESLKRMKKPTLLVGVSSMLSSLDPPKIKIVAQYRATITNKWN